MTEAFKVLCYELIADDGSGRRLIQFAYRIDHPTPCLRGDRLVRPNLKVR
jgi:hypothetical protein